MAVEVTMPVLGLTMTEGKIVRWLKNAGDNIKKGEPLLEIATDKIVTEVESPGEGILVEILYEKDAVVPVQELIAIIAGEGEDYRHLLEKSGAAATAEPTGAEVASGKETPREVTKTPSIPVGEARGGKVKISPLARNVAAEHNLAAEDIRQIKGSGPNGRIVKKDVLDFVETKVKGRAPSSQVEDSVVPLTTLRSAIAERMSKSWETPHFYLECEVDAGSLFEMRSLVNERLSGDGLRVSLTDILVKYSAHLLTRHSFMNVSYSPEGIITRGEVNIGVAVAIEEGLIVPVIRNADQKGLAQIARESKDLIGRAKENKLTMDEIKGGTFTISNLGMFSVESFTAIINPPEAAILSAGAVIEKPVAIEGEVVVRPRMKIGLGLDHRAIDGAQGAIFLSSLKDILENPWLLAL